MTKDQTTDDEAIERRAEEESQDGRAVARREGFGAAIDDDVEGHGSHPRGPEGQHPRATGDDDDVEGHGFTTRGGSTRGD